MRPDASTGRVESAIDGCRCLCALGTGIQLLVFDTLSSRELSRWWEWLRKIVDLVWLGLRACKGPS